MKKSASPQTLVESYPLALSNSDKMRGWKRSLTLYCRSRSEESGTPISRFRAAIKMRLTKNGFNTNTI